VHQLRPRVRDRPNHAAETGWGRSPLAGFKSATQQLEDYQKVKCPKCGTIEKDERILSYGFLQPKTVIWLVIAAVLTMLLVDVLV
jgi:hypothetical protein